MRKRVFTTLIIVFSVGSVAFATLLAARKAASQRRATAQKRVAGQPGARQRAARTHRNAGAAITGPTRTADPNRAPQPAVDDALFTNEEFFGSQASVARPYSIALDRVGALLAKYPKDARLHLHAARLAERLGQNDRTATEMVAYADLKKRSADALSRLANFYHDRAKFADEVRTLQELAKSLMVSERGRVYKRAAEIVRSHSLKEFKPADFFADLVAADPSSIRPVKDYVQELRLAKQNTEALAVLVAFQSKFPSELAYFLKTRSAILEENGDRRAAEDVYSAAFDPIWPRAVASDYYDVLRRFGRYRIVRRGLQERVRSGAADLDTISRLFMIFSYEGSYQPASQLLRDLEDRRARNQRAQTGPAPGGWTSRELETVASMFTSIGDYDQASRYLYTLYLTGGLQPASEQREQALYRLFKVMLDAAGSPTRVASGDLSFYKDVAQLDTHPGFMNGVLSLILSGIDPAAEFKNKEKAAAGYFNRAFAYRIFTAFKQEYVGSSHLAEMYLGVVNVFSALGEHRLAIEAGREFQQRFSDSPRYAEVSLRIADSYVALKDRTNERAVLSDLLDRLARSRRAGTPLVPPAAKRWSWGSTPFGQGLIDRIRYNVEAYSDTYDPTADEDSGVSDGDSEGDDEEESESDEETAAHGAESEADRGPTYSSLLERYVSSLAAEDKKTETVAFFWREIKKHPKEEGLYERFLRWLGQAQLVNEQLNAYNSAINQFDSNTWYHRLGRWYVRQKRGRELTRYSRRLISVFDEEEISDYLLRFAGYGATPAGDALNWDKKLAFDLYSYAHSRFPRNLFFVRGMLTYLSNTDEAQWSKLSAQYYFADRSIRDSYLPWLSKRGVLRERYAQARARRGDAATGGRGDGTTDAVAASPRPAVSPSAYEIFAADAALWLSRHDEAIEAYRRLASIYPGEPQYADRLADLTRSFGQTSDKLYEESASVFARMADIYPSEHQYRIKAGEVYAQLGDFKRAGDEWDKLIRLEPGERNTYLEVATVYWDYYQFDQAVRVFKDLRNVTGDQAIYAYRLGAVYEGKGEIDSALVEYVKVLGEPGDGRDTVVKRLSQLSRRAGLAEKIAGAYQKEREAHPGDWQLVIGYANYQAERERQADALAMLRTEVSRSQDVSFLESVRDLFRGILRPEDEQQVIERLVVVARDEREAMMYRLQLASFLERHGQIDQAVTVTDKLTADYPTNLGVVEESAQFYWRAGLFDRSLDLYKRTLARAAGPNHRRLTLQLARRQGDAGKPAEAEATLRALYDENRADTEVFSRLAATLGDANKLDELATLYQQAFKEGREAGLSTEAARARVAELRSGMIRTLDALGKHQDAVDQHIEIVNSFPEDTERLAAAIDYAEQHNLSDRLAGYYEKLTKEAFKNYRWNVVLGRIYERRGNLTGAAEQYRTSVVNEPQRADLRYALASSLARQRRYDEAIATLREGWRLAGRDPAWLIEVANIQVRQGKRDDAVQTIRQALAEKKNVKARDQLDVASKLALWGLSSEAARMYERVFGGLAKTLKDEIVTSNDVTGYVRALVMTEPVASTYQRIEQMRAQFSAIGQNSQDTDGYKARMIVSAIDAAMRSDFGTGVSDYATASEATALSAEVRASVAKLTTYRDAQELRRYLGIARGAALVDVEEQIQIRLKDTAFDARPKSSPLQTTQDTQFYSELRALVDFYGRHAAYARAAEALTAESKRDPYKNRFEYQNEIATQYRLAGDRQRELEALRAAYASASGGLSADTRDWVERYLSLLHGAGSRSELQRLASTYSPHQLQLINFLIEKKEKELALDAIASARQSAAWVASRSGEAGFFLKDASPDNELFFRKALDVRPIGQMLGRRVESGRALVGNDWFLASRNFGYWLGLVGREPDSRKFVVGEIEGHPENARAQLELAAYYLDHKNAGRAGDHAKLAAELEPGSRDVAVISGAIALAGRDRKAALEAWDSIIGPRASIADAQTYSRVMADNGFLRESLPKLESFIVAYTNRASREKETQARMEAIKPLIRRVAERGVGDSGLAAEIAVFFQNLVNSTPGDQVIGGLLIQERLLSEAALASIYRTVHQRLSDQASAVFGTSEYENGYYNGDEYVYPARALAEFRRRFIDYQIRTRLFDEARLLIATIERERKDLALAQDPGAESQSSSDERYEWLALASALIELRSGKDAAKAIAELRRYCGLETAGSRPKVEGSEGDAGGPLHERCLKAYALLLAENKDTEADALLYDSYSKAVRSRYANDVSLAGLAEIEARRGRGDESARLLKQLVERSTENTKALQMAAETAARINRFAEAIEFRQQLALANPSDAANRLELARAIAASGRASEAIDQIAALIGERGTGNSVRAQAAEVAGQLVRADRSLASRNSQFDERVAQGNGGAVLARASIAEAMGDAEQARSLLAGVSGPLAPVAQMKLGLVALAANREAEALSSFERAAYLDADGTMTDAIAFRAPGPRAQLIGLYSKTGRDLAAIRLASGEVPTSDGRGRRSLMRMAVRNALTGAGASAVSDSVAFEPPLDAARSKHAGLKTISELNDVAESKAQSEMLEALVESAARLGQYDRAIAMEQLRAAEARQAGEKTAIEKRLAELIAAEQAHMQRLAQLMRINRSNATESIYAARHIGQD
ncbi:MAG: hypothetical protein WAU45_04510 [Blastocatellia bacterium]